MGLLAKNNKKQIDTWYGKKIWVDADQPSEWADYEEAREPTAEEKDAAKQTFTATLTTAGIPPSLIEKLAGLGPMGIFRQYEQEILRFSSPEKEQLVLSAADAWCKALN